MARKTSQRAALADFEAMVLIREFETEAERQYKAARIGGYCHLSSGQEATTVGAVKALGDSDLLITGYRCHGFALARGVPGGSDGRALWPSRWLRSRPRRLDASARRRARLLRRLGDRRWPAPDRRRTRDGDRPTRKAGRDALRAWRRRRQHGRLARVPQPCGALGVAGRIFGRQQRLRDGHEC